MSSSYSTVLWVPLYSYNNFYLESESPGTSGMIDSFLWGDEGLRGDPPGAGDGTSSPLSPPPLPPTPPPPTPRSPFRRNPR